MDYIKHWPVTCERYLGFLDIMGFSEMITRQQHEDTKKTLIRISELTKTLTDTYENSLDKGDTQLIRSVIFSDTILFVSRGKSLADLVNLSDILKIFSETIIQSGEAPTKGVISFGKLTADFENSIFFGQPLVDAYLLQKELYYYGVILNHEVESILMEYKRDEIISEKINSRFIKLKTPIKGAQVNHYNLLMNRISNEHLDCLYKTVSGGVRKYVDNTVEVYQQMNKI